MYLKQILDRPEEEITKSIYLCQKAKPDPGDWCTLVDEDFNKIGMHISEDLIQRTTFKDYEDIVKTKGRDAAFRELNDIKAGHTKVKDTIYINMKKPQEYIISKEFTNTQCSLFFCPQKSHS